MLITFNNFFYFFLFRMSFWLDSWKKVRAWNSHLLVDSVIIFMIFLLFFLRNAKRLITTITMLLLIPSKPLIILSWWLQGDHMLPLGWIWSSESVLTIKIPQLFISHTLNAIFVISMIALMRPGILLVFILLLYFFKKFKILKI